MKILERVVLVFAVILALWSSAISSFNSVEVEKLNKSFAATDVLVVQLTLSHAQLMDNFGDFLELFSEILENGEAVTIPYGSGYFGSGFYIMPNGFGKERI